jgi:tetratricopeptide (TPR) repeat protein
VAAYNLYLKARYHLYKFTPDGLTRSKDYYEQAVAMDPDYALAWCGLAGFYWHLGFFGYLPPRVATQGFAQAVSKALAIDDLLPDVHADAALLRVNDYDWKGAGPEFQRALELGPWSDEVSVLYDYYYLVPMKRLEDAVAASRAALDLDPLSPFLQWRLGYRYYLLRQWDRTIAQCQSALELDPHYFAALAFLGFARLQQGRPDEAIMAFETAAQLMGRGPLSLGWLGFGYGRAGRTDDAGRVLAELQDLARKTYVLPPEHCRGLYRPWGP